MNVRIFLCSAVIAMSIVLDGTLEAAAQAGGGGGVFGGPKKTPDQCLADALELQDELAAAIDDMKADYEFYFQSTVDLVGYERFPFLFIDGYLEETEPGADYVLNEYPQGSEERQRLARAIDDLRGAIEKVEQLMSNIQSSFEDCNFLRLDEQPQLPPLGNENLG